MTIFSRRARAGLLVAFAAASTLLSGCSNSTALGPDAAQAALKGQTVAEEMAPGVKIPVTTINASALAAKGDYAVKGKIVINGNLPDGVSITANGPIVVNGDVGTKTTLEGDVPVDEHKEFKPDALCIAADVVNTAAGVSMAMNKDNSPLTRISGAVIATQDSACWKPVYELDYGAPGVTVNGAVNPVGNNKLVTKSSIIVNGKTVQVAKYPVKLAAAPAPKNS